jgi:ABC-type uncharacterized transport system substrate-binding protein
MPDRRWDSLMGNAMARRIMLIGLIVLLASSARAEAHPHVWVTVETRVLYAADGSVTGVRHAWSFDEMFSAFAVQGIQTARKGVYTRQELASLAEVNVTSLREYKFFTYAKASGKRLPFAEPIDYWLDFKEGVLTLHFTLPFKTPVAARNLELEIYDPGYFVVFALAEKDPVALVGAPPGCRLKLERPKDIDVKKARSLSEEFFNALSASSNWGAQFTNRIGVQC